MQNDMREEVRSEVPYHQGRLHDDRHYDAVPEVLPDSQLRGGRDFRLKHEARVGCRRYSYFDEHVEARPQDYWRGTVSGIFHIAIHFGFPRSAPIGGRYILKWVLDFVT